MGLSAAWCSPPSSQPAVRSWFISHSSLSKESRVHSRREAFGVWWPNEHKLMPTCLIAFRNDPTACLEKLLWKEKRLGPLVRQITLLKTDHKASCVYGSLTCMGDLSLSLSLFVSVPLVYSLTCCQITLQPIHSRARVSWILDTCIPESPTYV